MDNKTCPKSLRYSARANIPPDEQFKKDIQAVKLKAEQGSLSALTRFNYRRLEKQKTKLRKEKGKTAKKGIPKRGSSPSNLQNQPLSADINVKSLAAFLGMDSEKAPTLLSTLKAVVSTKNVEKYTCHFTEPCDNTTHKESVTKGKYKLTKKQIKTKKRNE